MFLSSHDSDRVLLKIKKQNRRLKHTLSDWILSDSVYLFTLKGLWCRLLQSWVIDSIDLASRIHNVVYIHLQ